MKLHLKFFEHSILKNKFVKPCKIHHIGYAVKDIKKALAVFSLLNYKIESSIIEDFERNIKILFIYNHKTRIELIQILDENKKSPIDFLFKKVFLFLGMEFLIIFAILLIT